MPTACGRVNFVLLGGVGSLLSYPVRMVAGMEWKSPDPHLPQLLDWWFPLVRAVRRALIDEVPWLILIDEWDLLGRELGLAGPAEGRVK